MRLASILILISAVLILPAAGQSQQNVLSLLQQKYMDFDYPAVINTGNLILRTAGSLSRNDSLEIYRLQGLSYYSLGDMTGALRCFTSMLRLDPDYKLLPRDNPPKVVDFFEEIRLTLISAVPPAGEKVLKAETIYPDSQFTQESRSAPAGFGRAMGYSLIMPGLGHLQYDSTSKGWILLCSGLLTLGSSIYFAIETNRREDAYLAAGSEDEIAAKYDNYNAAYKARNVSLILYGTIWLYSQLDLLYWSKPYLKGISLSPGVDLYTPAGLTLQVCF